MYCQQAFGKKQKIELEIQNSKNRVAWGGEMIYIQAKS